MSKFRGKALGVGAVLMALLVALLTAGTPAQAGPYDHLGTAHVSGGYFYLHNGSTNLCMEVTDANPANGAGVRQNYCDVTWAQQFQLVSIGVVNGVQAWRLKPRFVDSKCVDVKDGVTVAGQPLQIWQCSSGWQQMFEMVDVSGDPVFHQYQLRPVYNHWCVNVHDLYARAQLVEQPCLNGGYDYRDRWMLAY